jgi:shikimate kinase / 3-dehydroquinate synthase
VPVIKSAGNLYFKPFADFLSIMNPYANIILTGFMGTGKSTIGQALAVRLGGTFLDTDLEIERRAGISIPEIFTRHGEAHFRNLERQLCRELISKQGTVIATGGGMPLDPENRKLLSSAGIVLCLRRSIDEILARIGNTGGRPMLEGKKPADRVDSLLREREASYSSFAYQVNATGLSVEDSVNRVYEIVHNGKGPLRFLTVNLPGGGGYTIAVGSGSLDQLGAMLRDRGLTSRIAVVTDFNVAKLYADQVVNALEGAGFKPFICTVPPGEGSKSLERLSSLYQSFVAGRLDRRGSVVALGGGVIGDLAGFAAATYMRGAALVQCPTTLLAMVDSSVGGKTGVDLPEGKNLVGAFKQPILVAADTQALATLPEREIRMGMAELIKHAVIGDPELFEALERSDKTSGLDAALIARSANVKVRVVEADPFESGPREVLNLGHTVGHALEKCSEYSVGHGEAVSVGLVAAARISEKMGLCVPTVPDRLESLLSRTGLPVRHSADPDALVNVMAADKKAVEGRVRFVLIKNIGQVEYGIEVSRDLLSQVLEKLKNR